MLMRYQQKMRQKNSNLARHILKNFELHLLSNCDLVKINFSQKQRQDQNADKQTQKP